jgi:hypothetical protein
MVAAAPDAWDVFEISVVVADADSLLVEVVDAVTSDLTEDRTELRTEEALATLQRMLVLWSWMRKDGRDGGWNVGD